MFEIFLGVILSCLGVLAIAFTLFVLIAIVYVAKKQIKK